MSAQLSSRVSTLLSIVDRFSKASHLLAGAETSAGTMATFFLAMLRYPEVQERAFAELERVLGLNRLPTFEDKGKLPYITAIMKESLRYVYPFLNSNAGILTPTSNFSDGKTPIQSRFLICPPKKMYTRVSGYPKAL